MTEPDLGLDLSGDSIALMRRSDRGGWEDLVRQDLRISTLNTSMQSLRGVAQRVGSRSGNVTVLIPNDEIMLGDPSYAKGDTDYILDQSAQSSGVGHHAQAMIASATLDETHKFVTSFGFKPILYMTGKPVPETGRQAVFPATAQSRFAIAGLGWAAAAFIALGLGAAGIFGATQFLGGQDTPDPQTFTSALAWHQPDAQDIDLRDAAAPEMADLPLAPTVALTELVAANRSNDALWSELPSINPIQTRLTALPEDAGRGFDGQPQLPYLMPPARRLSGAALPSPERPATDAPLPVIETPLMLALSDIRPANAPFNAAPIPLPRDRGLRLTSLLLEEDSFAQNPGERLGAEIPQALRGPTDQILRASISDPFVGEDLAALEVDLGSNRSRQEQVIARFATSSAAFDIDFLGPELTLDIQALPEVSRPVLADGPLYAALDPDQIADIPMIDLAMPVFEPAAPGATETLIASTTRGDIRPSETQTPFAPVPGSGANILPEEPPIRDGAQITTREGQVPEVRIAALRTDDILRPVPRPTASAIPADAPAKTLVLPDGDTPTTEDASPIVAPDSDGEDAGLRIIAALPDVVPPARANTDLPTDPMLVEEQAAALAAAVGEALQTATEEAFLPSARAIQKASRPQKRPTTLAKPQQVRTAAIDPDLAPSARAILSITPPRARPRGLPDLKPGKTIVVSPSTTSRKQLPTVASVQKAATIENAIPKRGMALIGVYGTSSKRQALVRLRSGKFVKVGTGDTVGGFKVSAISSDAIRMRRNGRDTILELP